MNVAEIELMNINQEIRDIKNSIYGFDKFIYSTLVIGISWMCTKIIEKGFSGEDATVIAVVTLGSVALVFTRQKIYETKIEKAEKEKEKLLSNAKNNVELIELTTNQDKIDIALKDKDKAKQ